MRPEFGQFVIIRLRGGDYENMKYVRARDGHLGMFVQLQKCIALNIICRYFCVVFA
jgi:hypothetical protein